MEMTDTELQQLVEEVSMSSFKVPFRHTAKWNGRLRTTGGRYILQTHNLDFNKKVYEKLGEEELVKVIKHELCHYHLHLTGHGYQHRDRDFKILLKQVGGTRFVPQLEKPDLSKYHVYQCVDCHTKIIRKRRVNTKRFVCGKCRGKLKEVQPTR
jgi:SprT-like protein